MKFLTFFTESYKDCAKLLIEDADQLGLDLIAEPLADFKCWQQATQFKAFFVQRYMEKLHEDVCWIDADARIRKNPEKILELSSKDCDIAAVYFRDSELLSGTLWLANTPIVHGTIQNWVRKNAEDSNRLRLEQRNLQEAIKEQKELRILKLPPEYAYIFDLSKKAYPDIEPIIEHLQRSRAIRKQENVMRIFNITI